MIQVRGALSQEERFKAYLKSKTRDPMEHGLPWESLPVYASSAWEWAVLREQCLAGQSGPPGQAQFWPLAEQFLVAISSES